MTRSERLLRKELKLPEPLFKRAVEKIERDGFASFNELIRYALMKLLDEDKREGRKSEP